MTPPHFSTRRLALTGITLWAGLLTFAVYGRSLTFPFFSDDFFQIPFLDAHSLPEIWRTAEGLFFFRPLAFSLWKGVAAAAGYNPALFHLANLLLHWLNGVLVAWLTARLWAGSGGPNWQRGAIAGTLFLVFPFSYEGVAWIAALMHPQFLALLLLAVLSYLHAFYPASPRARGAHTWFWAACSLLCALLAPFAHENGVLVAPLIGVVELAQPGASRFTWRRQARALAWCLPLLAWWLWWRQVPAADGAGSLALNGWRTIGRNMGYFIQGGAYPLTWMGGWLRDRFHLDGFLVTLLLTLPAMIVARQAQVRAGWSRRSWLPWTWTAVSVLPAVLFLPWLHVSAAPRMLMLASVGIAWLWSDVLLALAGSAPRRQALACLLFGALLLQNVTFVRAQLALYARGGDAIRSAVAAATAAEARGETAVLLNFPAWIAPQRATYALGQEGDILVLGPELLPHLLWVHGAPPASAQAVRVDAIRQAPPDYFTGPLGSAPEWDVRKPTAIFDTRYLTNTIRLQPVGRLGPQSGAAPPLAMFGSGLELLTGTATRVDGSVQVELTWRLADSAAADMTVFVHLLNASGQLVTQADGDPLAGAFPFTQWPPHTVLQDLRSVETTAAVEVRVGLYNRVTGERDSAVSSAARNLPDSALIIPISP